MTTEKDKYIKGYDMHTRYLISYVQAFIHHAQNPDCFGLPDLERAEKAWRAANDYNVEIFELIKADWTEPEVGS